MAAAVDDVPLDLLLGQHHLPAPRAVQRHPGAAGVMLGLFYPHDDTAIPAGEGVVRAAVLLELVHGVVVAGLLAVRDLEVVLQITNL